VRLLVTRGEEATFDVARIGNEGFHARRHVEAERLGRALVIAGAALAIIPDRSLAIDLTLERRDAVAPVVADGLPQAVARAFPVAD